MIQGRQLVRPFVKRRANRKGEGYCSDCNILTATQGHLGTLISGSAVPPLHGKRGRGHHPEKQKTETKQKMFDKGNGQREKEIDAVTMTTVMCREPEAGAAACSGSGLELERRQVEEDGGHS